MIKVQEVWRDGFKILEFYTKEQAHAWAEYDNTRYNPDSTYEVRENLLPLVYAPYNPHPEQKQVNDCVKRAFTRLMNADYRDVSLQLNRHKKVSNAKTFNQPKNWQSLAKELGWVKETIKVVKGRPKTRAWEFARNNPQGKYLVKGSRHVLVVENGVILDSWDSRNEVVHHYWKVN